MTFVSYERTGDPKTLRGQLRALQVEAAAKLSANAKDTVADGWESWRTPWHYWHGKKSSVGVGAAVSAEAFVWLWCHLIAVKAFPEGVQLWHEGRCGRCGRTLTDPESCARGLGPICAGKGVG